MENGSEEVSICGVLRFAVRTRSLFLHTSNVVKSNLVLGNKMGIEIPIMTGEPCSKGELELERVVSWMRLNRTEMLVCTE